MDMSRSLFPGMSSVAEEQGPQAPLADRMRPLTLEQVVGQEHLLGPGRILQEIAASGENPSLLLWGPPGVGKTTLAHLMARPGNCHFISISAVLAGVKDVKRVVQQARAEWRLRQQRTVLFVDEIHRFNKAQQDAFLPHVENGTLILMGATTENPSFEVIPPLLSRSRVLVLKALEESHLLTLLQRALQEERGLGLWKLQVETGSLQAIARFADGDARVALNSLELAAQLVRRSPAGDAVITRDIVREALQTRTLRYDKSGEEHFNLISALHKSLRNSDPDASLYWLGRMLEAGEDPLYIARRMVRFASEDIGVADPDALGRAIDAMQAVHFIGLPEGKLALAQLAVYLAQAPKSNRIYEAYSRVEKDVASTRNQPVPLHLRNAPTGLMKELGYGRNYRYAHSEPDRVADMDCLPSNLAGRRYYVPSGEGFEREIQDRLEFVDQVKKRIRK
jgi:putative ATPase